MKKLFVILAAAAVLTPACNKVSRETVPSQKKTTLSVGIDNSLTKTQLSGTIDLFWTAGDAILVTVSDNSYKTFTLEGAGGSASGTFSINEEVTIKSGKNGSQSFYPETLNPTYNSVEDKTHVVLPDTYTWTEAGVKAPMYGWLNKDEPWDYLKLLTSVIKIDIYNIPATASKLVFTAAAETVSGDFIFPYDCIPVKSGDSNKSITINFTAGEASMRSFCIPVPYGTYSAGATFVLKNSSDVALVTKTAPAITVGKESISYFPAIDCGASAPVTVCSGPYDCTAWANWNQEWGLDLSSLQPGDRLRYNVTEESGDSYWQLKMLYHNGSDWVVFAEVGLYSGQTVMDYVLSAAEAAAISASPALAVQGYNVTVNNIQIVPNPAESVLWTGSHSLGEWDNAFDVSGLNSAGFWSNLKAGKQLTVYFYESALPDIAYCQFFIEKKSDQSSITGLEYNLGLLHQNVYSFTLTAAQVTAIMESGIVIHGKKITITKITLR